MPKPEPRFDRETMERVSALPSYRGFVLLKAAAEAKIERVEKALTRFLFTTTTAVDPLKIEYDRGFRQGVKYALEGLPNEIAAEWQRHLKESDRS